MKLTDPVIKAATPKEKRYSLPDGKGLILWVQPSGAKWWRYRYYYQGKEKMLSLGVYPEMTLKAARNEHVRFKELLAKGIDPSQHRQEQKQREIREAANSFESVARQWWNHWKHGKTERHAGYTIRRLEANVFPIIVSKPINEITAHILVNIIKIIESRGALDIAKRALTMCGQIFRYVVAHGFAERSPAADIKPSDVLKPTKKTNYARLGQKELPELLRKIEEYDGRFMDNLNAFKDGMTMNKRFHSIL